MYRAMYSGKYSYLRRLKEVSNLGYYITSDFVIYRGQLVLKDGEVRCAEHVARMGKAVNVGRSLVENVHFKDRGDGRITLRWVLQR
jgi:hypothetical protein